MREHQVRPTSGSRHPRKRVGRGYGSGHGGFSGRGTKGQKARSGGGAHPRFEGGQLPIIKRLPEKRGFTNIFRVEYSIVNLGRLASWNPSQEVTPERLLEAGLVDSLKRPIKILGEGEIRTPLRIKANKFSASAKRKIEAVGGRAEEIEYVAP